MGLFFYSFYSQRKTAHFGTVIEPPTGIISFARFSEPQDLTKLVELQPLCKEHFQSHENEREKIKSEHMRFKKYLH